MYSYRLASLSFNVEVIDFLAFFFFVNLFTLLHGMIADDAGRVSFIRW